MGVVLRYLGKMIIPKKRQQNPGFQSSNPNNMGGFNMSENFNNFTTPLGLGMDKVVELSEPTEVTVPVCVCGCKGVGKCCKPKGMFARKRAERAARRGDWSNFSMVSFLYDPQAGTNFEYPN